MACFSQAGPEGKSQGVEMNFPLEQRAGSHMCGAVGVGLEVVVPTDVLPHWQATQKGDPVAVLKRQLEEKEKQLTAEQEDAAAAKNKLRELSKVSTAQPPGTPGVGSAPRGHPGVPSAPCFSSPLEVKPRAL